VACGSDQTEVDVDFKCHTAATGGANSIQCVFKDGNNVFNGAAPGWFDPGSCMSVGTGSLLAKISNLPSLQGGQYHFYGTLKVCVANGASTNKPALLLEFLGDMAAPASEGRVIDESPARKGNDSTALGALSDAPQASGYCVRGN
jgi:hypothetical protein